MTAAGLDPSRIVERATVLAKVHGSKRKHAAAEMDVDEDMEDGSGEDGEAGWMDVDGDEDSPNKRAKGVSGGVVPADRRSARTDRRYAGMKDEAQSSRAVKLRNLGQRPRNMLAKAGEGDRVIKTKMVCCLYSTLSPSSSNCCVSHFPAKTFIRGQAQGWKDRPQIVSDNPFIASFLYLFLYTHIVITRLIGR